MSGKLAGQRCSVLHELTCTPKCFWMSWVIADAACGVAISCWSQERRVYAHAHTAWLRGATWLCSVTFLRSLSECGWRGPRTKMAQSCRGPTKQVRTHCAACLQRTKWLCRGFDDVLAPRLSGSGSYDCWCGGSGEGGPHPWPVFPKSKPCRICPTATEKWEWYSSNACWLNSHGMHYRLVSAKSSLRRLGLWKLQKKCVSFLWTSLYMFLFFSREKDANCLRLTIVCTPSFFNRDFKHF